MSVRVTSAPRERLRARTLESPLAERNPRLAVGATAAILVGGLASARGGYFPTSWGWTGVLLAWGAIVALMLGVPLRLTALEGLLLAGITALAGWFALSALWSVSVTSSVLEAERAIVYPLAVLVILLLVRRASVPALLAGSLIGTTTVCAYALATRLFADRLHVAADSIAGTRLATPIGYWNALGIFAAMGALLALGFASRAHGRVARAAAAAALVVIAPTLYLTFSRGAWLALGLGVAVAVTVDTRRLQLLATLLVAGIAPALAILFTSRTQMVSLSAAAGASIPRDGHRLALLVVLLGVATAGASAGLATLEERTEVPKQLQRMASLVLIAALLAGSGAIFLRYGSPAAIVSKGWRAFNAPPPTVQGSLNNRLFNFSSSGRNVQYRVGIHEFLRHPLVGSGAGTYEQYWLAARPLGSWKVRDAHSLYVETLGELGIVGLLLLVVAFGAPLLALASARRHPLASATAGAYAAYLVHAGFDWDWEMTGVTIVALICGAALVRMPSRRAPSEPRLVGGLALIAACIAGTVALVGLIGNTATANSAHAVQTEQWSQAERSARTARTWAPWSATPLMWLGEAEVGRNQLAAARRDLTAAIRKDPRSWELWFDLALASPRGSVAQKHELAVALMLNPLSPEVREFIAGIGLTVSQVTAT
ncbi:MAG: O-antigen ligase family protein [Gaiellaceae bacterium]